MPLDLLTPHEARDLLGRRLGVDRVAAEPDAVQAIISRCARLPLALAIVAARAATHPNIPLAVLVDELQDVRTRLDALSAGDAGSDVRVVFSWSYQALTPDSGRLFRLLGLHPGPDISAPTAASLAGLTPTEVRPLLTELTRAHLIVEHAPGRYTFHDLLRAYATNLASGDPHDQRQAAIHRILDHYLHTAHTAARLLYPHWDPITLPPAQPGVIPEQPADHDHAMTWFTAQHPVLLAAIDHAASTGYHTHTWQLAEALGIFLSRRGLWHHLAVTGAAALAAARQLTDPSAQAKAHRLFAHAHFQLGCYDDALIHLRQALDRYRETDDQVGQAYTHNNFADVLERQGRHAEALDHDRQALHLSWAAGHLPSLADALNAVGWSHAQLGDYQQALDHCQQALTLHQQLGDRWGESLTWTSLGYAHHHLGHHTQAITCYQHALDLWRDLGDRYEEAVTIAHLGDTHHTAGDPDAARHAWQHALPILTDLDHPDAENVRAKLDGVRRAVPN